MRVLVIGAGAVGGYFGGRLVEKGEDVTFLVRPRRQAELQTSGLVIQSVNGDFQSPVKTLSAGEESHPFDLILLTTKAYHLDQAMEDFAPYVGVHTTIFPVLNGFEHFDRLADRFGKEKVIGGLTFIESTLNAQGVIEHYSKMHHLVFGEWNGERTKRIQQIESLLDGANLKYQATTEIANEVWKKYLFIAAMSGMTSLMRSSLGPIRDNVYGNETYQQFLEELVAVALTQEPRLDKNTASQIWERTSGMQETMKSSMLRDIEKGLPIETDHFHGYLLRKKPDSLKTPILATVYTALSLYKPTN